MQTLVTEDRDTAPVETYDVIIVGAGPAGTSTALHLHQIAPHLAERTLVLEKARHPRPKPCAGGLLPEVDTMLEELGLDLSEVPHEDARWAYFEYQGRGTPVRPADSPVSFHVIRRDEFDAWLVQKTRERGIAILEETPVKRVTPQPDGVEVVTPRGNYRARVVVGADGAHSTVRRAIAGGRRAALARAVLLMAPPRPESSSHKEDEAYFDFFCVSHGVPGYVWDFPSHLQDRPMRCWGIYDSAAVPGRPQRQIRNYLAEELARHGLRLEDYTLDGAAIHRFDVHNVFSAPRVLLTGDAAGVDGLFGEGIAPALGYGRIAAQTIADAFEHGDFSFQDYRRRILHSELGKVLKRRAALAKLIYRLRSPVLQRLLWRQLGSLVQWTVQNLLVDWAKRELGTRQAPG